MGGEGPKHLKEEMCSSCLCNTSQNLGKLKSRITENKTYPRSGVKLYSSVATQIHITADCSSPDCMVGEGGGVCSAYKKC